MPRTPIVAANWKMNKSPQEARELVMAQLPGLRGIDGVEIVLCPPFVALPIVAAMLEGSGIGVGAQNIHWEKSGAYTGEISAAMLAGLAGYVIVGHSERRQFFEETDEGVNKKVKAALASGFTPIVCVGELLSEYETGRTAEVVRRQVTAAYDGLSDADARMTVIAYEPVWAIGTGKAATGAGANAVIGLHIRGALADRYGPATADSIRVQYGGSVTPVNIAEFMSQPDIDGALVGGASLKPDFVDIVRAASPKIAS